MSQQRRAGSGANAAGGLSPSENEERFVDALREAADSRAQLLARLESSSHVNVRCADLTKQLLTSNRTISDLRERESALLGELAALREDMARRDEDHALEAAEAAKLRAENAALRNQCEFLTNEVRTSISLVSQASKRSTELSKMVGSSP